MRLKTARLSLILPLALAACSSGGGGGSSSGGQSGPGPFVSFSAIGANSVVQAQSGGQSVNYRAAVAGGNVSRDGDIIQQTATLRFETGNLVDPNDPSSAEIEARRLTVNVPGVDPLVRDFTALPEGVGAGDAAGRFGAYESEDENHRLYLNQDDDLDYMTYGIWELGLGQASIDIGGAAWGALTPTAGENPMPISGSATYEGDLIGYNVRATTTDIYVARSILEASFTGGGGTVTFSSTETRNLATGNMNSVFDIEETSGTISGNTFSGTGLSLNVAGASFDGDFGGAFFGPDAAEAGGWFELRNTGGGEFLNDRYFGAFGGAKQP